MSARRQSSTTSLSKYARQSSPVLQNRSFNFCNSFWGISDGGVDVLFARMRGATRTTEEVKNFWKERAAIEEDYAKRLAKLSKAMLGRDEIGDLRHALDILKSETDRQASIHQNLVQQIKSELETPTVTFHARQVHHRKTYQTSVEKEFKTKQTQEAYVTKAREKYEQDCLRINAFTAQSSLVQGKDLEKINLKLERTQQTVQVNEREFAKFADALQETVAKWEETWKNFCDSCQDLEEQRMDFMKDNVWAYANAVSTVCVADDESCEKIRLALEQMETERDMENFVQDYGTGNQIPDPPTFINYQAPDAVPSSAARPTTRTANFVRNSTRELPPRQNTTMEEEPVVNTAGIGAGGGGAPPNRRDTYDASAAADISRRSTQATGTTNSQYTNGVSSNSSYGTHSPYSAANSAISPTGYSTAATSISPTTAGPSSINRHSTVSTQSSQQQQLQRVLHDPYAGPIDPTAETYIKVGDHAYKVDPAKDPQNQLGQGSGIRTSMATSPTKANMPSGEVDPLMKQLEELKNAVNVSGSVRRNTVIKPKTTATTAMAPTAAAEPTRPTHQSHMSGSSRNGSISNASALSPPGTASLAGPSGGSSAQRRSPSPMRDYRNSAEMVVGAHPSISRPASPNPPTAAFMAKPAQPAGLENLQDVLADYQQSLPGERKSISRSNSRSHPPSHAPSASQTSIQTPLSAGQNLARPASIGHAGIGAHGSRSPSPQPISRGPSPQPGQVSRPGFISPPSQAGPGVARAPSPNSVGIALDPSGRVMHDELAQRYQQQQQQQQQQQRPMSSQIQPQQQYVPPQPAPLQQSQRRTSYMGTPQSSIAPPPSVSPQYGMTPPQPPPQQMYHQTPSPQPSYLQQQQAQMAPPAPQQPIYNAPPPPQQQYQAPPPQQQQPRYIQQQAPASPYGSVSSVNGLQRGGSMSIPGGYYGGQPSPQQQPQQQHVQAPQQQQPQQHLGIQQAQAPQQRIGPHQASIQQARGAYQQQQQQPQRSPSPQPPPQTTDDGNTVLFYVRALYDYTATIEEEFDFQAGDIIAVTSTPEDGWWTGELLDEARRQKGRNVFPSNFVCLF